MMVRPSCRHPSCRASCLATTVRQHPTSPRQSSPGGATSAPLSWRPITAIRLADTDGNPATLANPTWLALAPTAADPSYPGAHSTISAAGATVLAAIFGNDNHIVVTLSGVSRTFGSYDAVATEAGLSRILAGQPTRIDHVAGLDLGQDVARFVIHQISRDSQSRAD